MDKISVAEKAQAIPSVTKVVAERRDWWKIVKSHLRRMPLEIINFFINHDLLFWLVGLINKKVSLIESVFLVYPASEKYGLSFAYSFRLRKNRWNPWPTGLLWQNGKLTVMFAISATNEHFTDSNNLNDLGIMERRVERLRELFGANRKTFAGILPGILYAKQIVQEAPEADLTAVAVVQAIEAVQIKEDLGRDTPIIVLGGKGFIGRRVVGLLKDRNVYSIDSSDGQNEKNWPALDGSRSIVVNITLNNAVKNYIDAMPRGTVIINEVYPPPSQEVLDRLSSMDCRCYHVVGIQAKALPSFPAAYQGAIPCCAAWPSDEMRVVVRAIN